VRLHTLARSGALGTTIACAAAAPAAAQSPQQTVPMRLADATVHFGAPAVAKGNAGGDAAGRTAVLEFRTPEGWQAVGRATVGARGAYRVRGEIPGRGRLRVTLEPQPGVAAAATDQARSPERRIKVLPRVAVNRKRLHVRSGRRAVIKGRIAPRTAGRAVRLQVRRNGSWRTLDRSRTRSGGRYALRGTTRFVGSHPVRVAVAGGGPVNPRKRKTGRLNAYRSAHASWYGPGLYGNRMACGRTLTPGTLGVAHKTLPCGTKVTFRNGRRTVRVKVVDRGPYVGGREYDLTAATANRLGFRGHGAVLATR
jgi:rare lipoprotein A